MITQDELKKLLNYDPETGVFTRQLLNGLEVAGSIDSFGHRQIQIGSKRHMAHRLAWLYVFGEFPNFEIDHINGDPDDNRINNLRLATRKQNMENRKLHVNNTSGHRGITWHRNKWEARVSHHGKRIHVGNFNNLQDAVSAAKAAREQLFTHDHGRDAA